MIIPKKHIEISDSLFGIGGVIIDKLKRNSDIDELIKEVLKFINEKKTYIDIDRVVLAMDYLYTIGVIDFDSEGGIYNVFEGAMGK